MNTNELFKKFYDQFWVADASYKNYNKQGKDQRLDDNAKKEFRKLRKYIDDLLAD